MTYSCITSWRLMVINPFLQPLTNNNHMIKILKFIRWGNTVSSSFHVTNGVKQGGIISSVLFNVYMDDLSISLNNSGTGGHIGEKAINHLCYADDICLIPLSSSAMQQLLNICHTYSTEHSLLYKGNKSF